LGEKWRKMGASSRQAGGAKEVRWSGTRQNCLSDDMAECCLIFWMSLGPCNQLSLFILQLSFLLRRHQDLPLLLLLLFFATTALFLDRAS